MKARPFIPDRRSRAVKGFTLVELLVSIVVLSILLLVTMTALDSVQNSWKQTKGKVNQFREARIAFETITRNLSQATLNIYWDYYFAATKSNVPPAGISAPPAGYVRQSELDFQAGLSRELGGGSTSATEYPGHSLFFQAPLGLSQQYRGLANLLNGRGYYVRFTSNDSRRPTFLPGGVVPVKHRYQLMEYRPPAEQVNVSGTALQGNTVYTNPNWITQNLVATSRPIANNILLLLISPQVPVETLTGTNKKPWWIAPAYHFRSRDSNNATTEIDGVTANQDGTLNQGTQHLLPPIVKVTLVAGEEITLSRWHAEHDDVAVDILREANAPFTEAQHYERDLDRLKQFLSGQNLNFRVFTAAVPLRNASWDTTTF